MNSSKVPVFAQPDIELKRQPDRALLMRSREALGSFPVQTGEWIRHWATETPDAIMLAERRDGPDRWTTVTFGAAAPLIDRLSQSLLDLGLSQDRPLAVLSEKSIRHGLLLFAAMQVGICSL